MATGNPFDILGDDDNDDPSQLIAKQEQKIASKKTTAAAAPAAPAASSKFPSKPAPPAQAAKDARSSSGPSRGGPGRGGFSRGGGRGTRDFRSDREKPNGFQERPAPLTTEEGGDSTKTSNERSPRQQGYRGGFRRGGEEFDKPRRTYERHSGTGRGFEMKRDGSGRGNWGSSTDEQPIQESEETVKTEEKEKPVEGGEEAPRSEELKEIKEEEPEDKEMTLEEYEKIREEKRKALLALKAEERKVEIDKDLQAMHLLSTKKSSDPIFIKLGSEKDSKKKDAEKDERAKKSLSINEFLKPAEGERGYGGGRRGGRGGRGGQMRGGFGGGFGGGSRAPVAPAIGDQSQFPTLGGK